MVPENQIPIVFEVNDKSQNELLKPILTSNTFPIQRESFYSMITTHTILQSGISSVFSEIYSSRGNEIYIYPSDGFAGKTYGESLVLMNNASLIGIIQEGETILNPPHTSIIQHDDKLVIVMQDDEPISKVEKPRVFEDETKNHSINDIINTTVNDILILGWNNVGNGILVELSKYITHETNITIVSDEIISTSDIGRELQNESVHLHFVEEAHFKKQTLDSLNIGSFDKIVILSSDHLSPEESDTITISAILQIKSLMEEGKTSKIISQILVEKNVSLLNDDPILEFIVSDSLLTGMVSQIAENSELYHALHDILDEEGSEIYAVDMESLSRNTTSGISILEAYSRIRDLGGSMIGYQSFIDDKGGKRIKTVINPPKDSNIHLNDSNKLLVVCEG
jgi:Trk K+ transport system NAD-binding subunit